jgi:poly(hydroxyalkanoate) depolymerase family esterase
VLGPRQTITDIIRQQQRWLREQSRRWVSLNMPVADAEPEKTDDSEAGLTEIADFGSNPGALRMLVFLPDNLLPDTPLVVALHGCTQIAAAFDRACGWSELASQAGFALLLPEQRLTNNSKGCFNWFATGDTRRDAGEALSIRQMINWMLLKHGLNSKRVYIAGLSAGGAMATVMLATYPEVFAAGAIIGGVPYGSATDARQARPAMAGKRNAPAKGWGGVVRAASSHLGPWPRVSIWHGDADPSVHPVNAERLVEQWTDLHGLTIVPAVEGRTGDHLRRVWHDANGTALVESHTIAGMAHGAPIRAGTGPGCCGTAGPATLDIGVSSTHHILEFWGLASRLDMTATSSHSSVGNRPPRHRRS